MAEPNIPADLADKIAKAIHRAGAYCGDCDWESAYEPDDGCTNCQEILSRYARGALATLATWANGALIDPNGWRRYDATEVGRVEVMEWTDDGLPVDFGIDLTDPGECCDGDTLHVIIERDQ